MSKLLHQLWEKIRAPGALRSGSRVLAVVLGEETDALTLRLAGQLGQIEALRLVDIPRDQCLPTSAQCEAVADAERKRLGRQVTLQVESPRSPCACVLERVQKSLPSLLLLSAPLEADEERESFLLRLLQEAPCDTLIIRLSPGLSPESALAGAPLQVPLRPETALSPDAMARLVSLQDPSREIELVGLLEVPRSLPTDAPMPNEEELLQRLLEVRGEALRVAGRRYSMSIKKTRNLTEELFRAAESRALLISSELLGAVPELPARSSQPLFLFKEKK